MQLSGSILRSLKCLKSGESMQALAGSLGVLETGGRQRHGSGGRAEHSPSAKGDSSTTGPVRPFFLGFPDGLTIRLPARK